MLHLSTVEPATLELLRKLQSLPILNNTRLVGGTALALQFGHRKSVDLDFFGHIDVDSLDLQEALQTIGTLTTLKDSKNIHIYSLDGIKIDIVNYAYPWLDDVVIKNGYTFGEYQRYCSNEDYCYYWKRYHEGFC